MKRFAEFVLGHRLVICLTWLVLLVAGGAAAGQLGDRLSFDFSLPGQPGYETERQIEETYGISSFDTFVPLLTVPDGQTVDDGLPAITAVWDAVRDQLPELRIVDYASTGDPAFVSSDGRTTFALVQGPLPASFGPGVEVALGPVFEGAAAQAASRRTSRRTDCSRPAEKPRVRAFCWKPCSERRGHWRCCCSCTRPSWPCCLY